MQTVDIKDFAKLEGQRIRIVNKAVLYEGTVHKVEEDYVYLNAGITDIPQFIRLDRRVMSPSTTFIYKLSS